MYLGSWKVDDLLTFVVNTHSVSTGAATDADSVPTYRVYEDETTTPILTGSMALLDGSNTAGLYSEQITLSAANGFEKGKSYNVYISAVVGGITGTVSRTFQIQAEVDVPSLLTAIADSVPADGSRPSIAQGIYAIYQFLTERSVSSTILTVKKPDGSTSLMTFTLSDAASPTSITRAS